MMTYPEYLESAARQSKCDAKLWSRYLSKVIFAEGSYLTDDDINQLLESRELTTFQKVSLTEAFKEGTPTHDHVVSLTQPAKLTALAKVKAMVENG